ncbi:MAG: CPBP family intramembrane metalloprotease [Bacilli bacterium]|nr:CPBP family intramembrane metalloprotease [Bacilli bacterium]MDD4608046.1 CPBP family intramembrane metalloprotease [Bacilli bacterium]
MYQVKNKSYALIAVIYFIFYMFGFLLMGVLFKNNVSWYYLIYWFLFAVAILIVLFKDKKVENLGITKDNLFKNTMISISIIVISFIIGIFISDLSITKVLKALLYFLFYVSMVEEVVFRGFIQNYLLGLKINKKLIFIIGGIFFALIHLPFQMYVNNMVSINYVIQALPQLIFTFVFHIIMCYITYKRKDITIPIALHFALDFLQHI